MNEFKINYKNFPEFRLLKYAEYVVRQVGNGKKDFEEQNQIENHKTNANKKLARIKFPHYTKHE
ncbi:hypothetical protein DERP_014437 [Dermatophagoides pteronyssinus]|uniref:Uncharacterized protein n=1 Tax=Dermatophagoides pteronyssinus TaxID=6956 RepID=A0ABQ8IW33_DERPT|nr:hypothetical protein DERP_014437 [Dermatophagoides pteronyssinus]